MLYGGLDLGSKRCRLHVIDEQGQKVCSRWVETTAAALREACEPYAGNLVLTVEASSGAFWVHDVLCDRVKVKVAHPKDLRAIAHARIKNDRLDAQKLAELTRADLIPEVWVPPAERRHQRELLLETVRVGKEIRKEKVRIRAMLSRWGLSAVVEKPWTRQGRQQLLQLSWPINSRTVMERKLTQLGLLEQQRRQLQQQVRAQIQINEATQRLMSMPGVGEATARLLENFIGEVTRFGSGRQLAAYFGLAPGERSSGQKVHITGITHEGNRLLRWALVQSSWRALRSSKDPKGEWRDFYQKLVNRGKSKCRAIVAVANRLSRVIHAILKHQRKYQAKAPRPQKPAA